MDTPPRIGALRSALKKKKLDAMLLSGMKNIRWLTGFTGSSAFAILTERRAVFVTDSRYTEQAGREVEAWEILPLKNDCASMTSALFKKLGVKKAGFEASVTYGFYEKLAARRSGVALIPLEGIVEGLRAVKDSEERAKIIEAIRRAEESFKEVRPYIKPGAVERSLARRLEDGMRRRGAERLPFDIILASGPNSAMPHARPGERRLAPGDLVVVDWGAECGGYFSDMTRTLLLKGGAEIPLKKRIYSLVLKANRTALEGLGPGMSVKTVDNLGRDVIKNGGYAERFGHGSGHGVGLDIHESPNLSPKGRGVMRTGMIATIEPGIYLPGTGGVRVEDMALITETGARTLTSLPKGLEANII